MIDYKNELIELLNRSTDQHLINEINVILNKEKELQKNWFFDNIKKLGFKQETDSFIIYFNNEDYKYLEIDNLGGFNIWECGENIELYQFNKFDPNDYLKVKEFLNAFNIRTY